MFWISRAGDRAASAATVSDAIAAPAAARTAPPVPGPGELSPATGAAIGTSDDRVELRTADAVDGETIVRPALAIETAATNRATTTAPRPARPPAPATGPAPRAASRPAPIHSPAAPRLRAKVDPDGTLDVYR
jgi:hypothetical protein